MRKWGFEEEKKPMGETGKLSLLVNRYGNTREADLSSLLSIRVAKSPWFIVIWEPLPLIGPPMKMDEPNIYGVGSQLYCCYINTIIIYKYPYRTKENGHGSYEEWGRCESQLMQEDVVGFEGEKFKVGCGSALFAEGSYWMIHVARREKNNSVN